MKDSFHAFCKALDFSGIKGKSYTISIAQSGNIHVYDSVLGMYIIPASKLPEVEATLKSFLAPNCSFIIYNGYKKAKSVKTLKSLL